jgi:hypothetical protein
MQMKSAARPCRLALASTSKLKDQLLGESCFSGCLLATDCWFPLLDKGGNDGVLCYCVDQIL